MNFKPRFVLAQARTAAARYDEARRSLHARIVAEVDRYLCLMFKFASIMVILQPTRKISRLVGMTVQEGPCRLGSSR